MAPMAQWTTQHCFAALQMVTIVQALLQFSTFAYTVTNDNHIMMDNFLYALIHMTAFDFIVAIKIFFVFRIMN